MPLDEPATAGWAGATPAPGGVPPIGAAASRPAGDVLADLATTDAGLTAAEAAARLRAVGPNAVRTHHARLSLVFARQFRNPLLLLLGAAAAVAYGTGSHTEALIIALIMGLGIGLGFANEARAEKAAEALHSQLRHEAVVRRDGVAARVPVTELVPGDIVRLELGEVVPADVRLLRVTGLECDESVLTGESLPVAKQAAPVPVGTPLAELTSCALMGSVVRAGAADAVVVGTGGSAEFGRVALGLGDRPPPTAFDVGLSRFSRMLATVAGLLTVSIFAVNLALHRPLIDALLFSLAIAIGLTPQLLPAVVSVSLSVGARHLARKRVLVKRLASIEDLGNVELLFTDKTGTLTLGAVGFLEALDPSGAPSDDVLRLGLLCSDVDRAPSGGPSVGGSPLDRALWDAPVAASFLTAVDAATRLGTVPFDHDRRLQSVVVEEADAAGRARPVLVTKGAPEAVLARCTGVPAPAAGVLERLFADGRRVVAVGSRRFEGDPGALAPSDERDLALCGFLVFLDPPKPGAADSLARLDRLGIAVKILTGDAGAVAEKLCVDLGFPPAPPLTGTDVDALDDRALVEATARTNVFARVSPEQKARIVRAHRKVGTTVAYLGDGVNDAVALHEADVGVSVDGATDVARDAADIVLLDKDLGVLADGVAEGRRIFANTVKYVLMATSSNFGNMFSAAIASAFLTFLPMLPSQILLNNLLYDVGEMTIPTDAVDEELLRRPEHWDIRMIRRFMVHFGPISSLFDLTTFLVLRKAFDAGPALFRAGWFVESLTTQALVVFLIRTRRVPFFRSRPSGPLFVATLACVAVGAALPYSPVADTLGFAGLPLRLLAVLAALTVVYLVCIEAAKKRFFRRLYEQVPVRVEPTPSERAEAAQRVHERRVHRRAHRWTHRGPLARPSNSDSTRPGPGGER